MVFVKVRETYDLHTTKNKMTVIGIHTPDPAILKRNYPGLLMQCKAYRPVSADVRIACASVMPLDPLGVGTSSGDVAPEDVFNPILYKAMSNFGMSQLEARINTAANSANWDISGAGADVDTDSITPHGDEFAVYYGLLANTHEWKHASPQQGLEMINLKPLVYEMLYNVGDNDSTASYGLSYRGVSATGEAFTGSVNSIRGNAKPMPFINCTGYTYTSGQATSAASSGFAGNYPANCEQDVPYLKAYVGVVIVPPCRSHELFFRMICEWTIEFSSIRPISEITDWNALGGVGTAQHFQNYSYSSTKEAITGSDDTILNSDTTMVSSNVDVNKVM